jgi:hypothetical protein
MWASRMGERDLLQCLGRCVAIYTRCGICDSYDFICCVFCRFIDTWAGVAFGSCFGKRWLVRSWLGRLHRWLGFFPVCVVSGYPIMLRNMYLKLLSAYSGTVVKSLKACLEECVGTIEKYLNVTRVTCNALAPYYIVICFLPGCIIFFHII